MIDWKRKLTSRKFWLAVVEFVTLLLLAFGVSDSVVTQVSAIIMSGAGIIVYIYAEGWADANRAGEDDMNDVTNAAEDDTDV